MSSCVADLHHFGKLDPVPDPYPCQSGKVDPDPHHFEMLDPDPQQPVKNLSGRPRGSFWSIRGSIFGKSEW